MNTKQWFFGLIGISIVSIAGYVGVSSWYPKEKPLVIIVPSYNNAQWYARNLDSLFKQNYSNYRIVYINDCSSDNTYYLVKKYIQQNNRLNNVTLINNEERKGALANLYDAIHECNDNEIILMVDGDDWLKDENVLQKINAAYDDANVLMTYGQYEEYPNGKVGQCAALPEQVIKQNLYREYCYNGVVSHLRTCYAWLFKKIKKEDLLYNNTFYRVTWDKALMFPMLEMAAGRVKFIDEVLYVYNMANQINDFKIRLPEVLACDKHIRGLPKYAALQQPYVMG